MNLFLKCMFLILAIGSFAAGVDSVADLRPMLVAETAYERGEGSVLNVTREMVSGGGDGPNYWVYQVTYQYRTGQRDYTSKVLSPACDLCVASEVKQMTGRLPKALAAGDPVTVYSLRSEPQVAYLGLATAAQLRSHYWRIFFLLIVAPIWFYAFSLIKWETPD